jgi:hypothetical protein
MVAELAVIVHVASDATRPPLAMAASFCVALPAVVPDAVGVGAAAGVELSGLELPLALGEGVTVGDGSPAVGDGSGVADELGVGVVDGLGVADKLGDGDGDGRQMTPRTHP